MTCELKFGFFEQLRTLVSILILKETTTSNMEKLTSQCRLGIAL